ncbi:hypothetical protein [Paenibacillus sedimenti]|nr:hypothetical protein [Paenibacillus sedimenti]
MYRDWFLKRIAALRWDRELYAIAGMHVFAGMCDKAIEVYERELNKKPE